jgi:predicted peroxiredoxin
MKAIAAALAKRTVVALAILLIAGCTAEVDTQVSDSLGEAAPGPVVVMNIVSGIADPHPVTMALQLAGHALDDGREVVLFFNVKGAAVPTIDLPEDLAFHDRPMKELIENLITRGASVLVCPHCMQALDIGEEDLLEGVEVASRETLFGSIHENSVVFSY